MRPKSTSAEVSPDWVLRLLDWYHQEKRSMPWRDQPTPYRVWISEIMLQQTQVATVIPYFERFITRFANIHELAIADLQDVLKLWEGLGYYSRARNLHKAAQRVDADFNGQIPRSLDQLRNLPGLGPYTAAAIASIAFGAPTPVVDGNVLRVYARFFASDNDITKPASRIALTQQLEPYIRPVDPSAFNQANMELGALVCRPREPRCASCPLATDCLALAEGRVAQLPVKSKKPQTPTVEIAVGLVWKNGKVLVARRPENKMLGGLWEFPGGKVKPDECPEETVERELREETGISVLVTDSIGVIRHTYTHFKLVMHAFSCTMTAGRARPLASDELRWMAWDDLQALPFPKANLKLFDLIKTTNKEKNRQP
jgi:A/G-specific adenine glycosylase